MSFSFGKKRKSRKSRKPRKPSNNSYKKWAKRGLGLLGAVAAYQGGKYAVNKYRNKQIIAKRTSLLDRLRNAKNSVVPLFSKKGQLMAKKSNLLDRLRNTKLFSKKGYEMLKRSRNQIGHQQFGKRRKSRKICKA